jgi:glutathione S-transferase
LRFNIVLKKAINPKGLVPSVEYKGATLYESLVLCEFFEDAFPDYKPNLLPSDPVQRALARLALDHLTKTFIPAFYRLIQAQEAEKQHAALQELYESLRKFTENIQGPYFFGESFSLVDVAIAPWIVRDYIIEEYRGYKRSDVSSSWKNYAEIVEVRKSVVRTQSVSSFFYILSIWY